ncbi:hypothetical protein [Mycobacterium sp. SMC-13]|uniref:hypothetical protein n=1 Tax=Mycobacterium sp. SMC-13 TaxID=3381626 RepID=UPI0038761179
MKRRVIFPDPNIWTHKETHMIGNDTITLVKRTRVGTNPTFNEPIYEDTEITVTGCSFQAGQPIEQRDLGTVVVSATAKVFMPVTPDTISLSLIDTIKYDGRTWRVRGPVITPTDLDGNPDHVWCIAQWMVS